MYTAPTNDIIFYLKYCFNIEEYSSHQNFTLTTPDLIEAIIDEAGKFATNQIAPTNIIGDHQGCNLSDGTVTTPAEIKTLYQDFVANGWKMKSNDSEVTQGEVREGISAGTAGGVKKHWGCCAAQGVDDGVGIQHRVSLIHWNGLVKGGVDLGSVYLISGEGPSEANLELLEEVGEHLVALKRPFVIGGDWQMTVDELESTGWVQRVGGMIVRPHKDFPPSCSSGSGRMIDYFVIAAGLAHMVEDCYVVEEATTVPHRPVRIVFWARIKAPMVRMLKKPEFFPSVAVFGPRREQDHWGEVVALANDRSDEP